MLNDVAFLNYFAQHTYVRAVQIYYVYDTYVNCTNFKIFAVSVARNHPSSHTLLQRPKISQLALNATTQPNDG